MLPLEVNPNRDLNQTVFTRYLMDLTMLPGAINVKTKQTANRVLLSCVLYLSYSSLQKSFKWCCKLHTALSFMTWNCLFSSFTSCSFQFTFVRISLTVITTHGIWFQGAGWFAWTFTHSATVFICLASRVFVAVLRLACAWEQNEYIFKTRT